MTSVAVGGNPLNLQWLLSAQGTYTMPLATLVPNPPQPGKGYVSTSYPVQKVEIWYGINGQWQNTNNPITLNPPPANSTWSITANTNIGAVAVGQSGSIGVRVTYMKVVATTYDVPAMGPPRNPTVETTGPFYADQSFSTAARTI